MFLDKTFQPNFLSGDSDTLKKSVDIKARLDQLELKARTLKEDLLFKKSRNRNQRWLEYVFKLGHFT